MPKVQNTMLHLFLDCNVVSKSGVSTSVSSTLGYLLLFHPILGYPILRPRRDRGTFYADTAAVESMDGKVEYWFSPYNSLQNTHNMVYKGLSF